MNFIALVGLLVCVTFTLHGCGSSSTDTTTTTMNPKCTGFDNDAEEAYGHGLSTIPMHALYGWVKQSRADLETVHELIFAVKLKDRDRMEEIFFDRSNPDSPNYGKWLSASEADALTMNTDAVEAVHNALTKIGAKVLQTTRGGELIRATAPVKLWEDFLQCEFHAYTGEDDDRSVHLVAETHTIPSMLLDHLDGVLGVRGFPPIQRHDIKVSARDPEGVITPAKLRSFYKMPDVAKEGSPEWEQRTKTSQAVYASLDQHWSPADRQAFQTKFNLPLRPVKEYNEDGRNMSSDTVCQQVPDNCTEASLDVQYMLAMSPWSAMGFYYSPDDQSYGQFLAAILDLESPPEVISMSYGMPELGISDNDTLRTSFNNFAMKLGTRGVSIVVSSGDDGAQSSFMRGSRFTCDDLKKFGAFGLPANMRIGLQVNWPASSPYVTGIGATMGVEKGQEEVACQTNCKRDGSSCKAATGSAYQGSLITTGGGYSRYDKPKYQDDAVKCKGRGVPDVSLAGHNYVVMIAGNLELVDGTSASAPAFGGMLSQVNARRKAAGQPTVGFINQVIYKSPEAFNDITKGDNKCGTFDKSTGVGKCCGGYDAGPGWDATTGLGTVDFEKFEKLFDKAGKAKEADIEMV